MLEFVPYQDAPSPPMTPVLRAACSSALHVITPDSRLLRGGAAAAFVLGCCGHPRLAGVLALPGVRTATEGAYRLVARYRGSIWRSRAGRWLVERWFRVA